MSQCLEAPKALATGGRNTRGRRQGHRLEAGDLKFPNPGSSPGSFSSCDTETLFSYLQNVYKNDSRFLPLMSGANEQGKCFLRSYENICCFVGGIIHNCNTALSIGYCTVFKYKSTGIFLGAKYCYFYNSKIIGFNYYDL